MGIIKLLIACLWLLLVLTLLLNQSDAVVLPNEAAGSKIRGPKLRTSETTGGEPKKAARVEPKRGCGEMVSRSECSQNPKCRWCRSDALDDMCFSNSEAWRLPSQCEGRNY